MILPVILSGGFGTRLWPLSRKDRPKQFLRLLDKNSLFQDTIMRVANIPNSLPPLFICNEDHRFLIARQLQEIDVTSSAIILEPVGKNTAPAITIAALQAMVNGDDPILLILPSDHLIANQVAFLAAVDKAAKYAQAGKLITFGIVPHKPETGYGYIQAGEKLADGVRVVDSFVEKPTLEKAKNYLEAGNYYWNGGIFMFRASRFLREMNQHAPDILAACCKAFKARVSTPDFIRLDKEIFSECRSDSVDYAVMEKTNDACVVPMDVGWSDVGCWSALFEVSAKDDDNNVKVGDVVIDEVNNSYLRSEGRTLAAIGVQDMIVVETKDAVLVARKDQSQKVKSILERLEKKPSDLS
ncbi:MAG: mannose-1-phosphate guanylyltransferase/mannose-6-phosphate isomerase [Gammaproteobacteria bacterium]|jgi:mannose-1-phosphate guanylyltransferase